MPLNAGFGDEKRTELGRLNFGGIAHEIAKSIRTIRIIGAEAGVIEIVGGEEEIDGGHRIGRGGKHEDRWADLRGTAEKWQAVVDDAEISVGIHLSDLDANLAI